ncbi:MAG TPA: SMC-Scp complex subunit ScpB [Pseudomonadales bacterium]|nr:SMC-Scp complex subunit ScpB [Pseudomonadales bacterium]
MSTSETMIRNIVEAALLAAGEPVTIDRLVALFDDGADAVPAAETPAAGAGDGDAADVTAAPAAEDDDQADADTEPAPPAPKRSSAPGDDVGRDEIRAALAALADDYAERGLELREVASGWRVQVRPDLAPWISRLWESRPPKYSRALLETLALIAYQQPVTRGDIENVRGVSVSSNIIKTLLDRDWVRIVGHRDVPGRPALYGTSRGFLDYFNLRSLDQLPPLAEIRELAQMNEELRFDEAEAEDERMAEKVPLSAVLGQFETPEDHGEVIHEGEDDTGGAPGAQVASAAFDDDLVDDDAELEELDEEREESEGDFDDADEDEDDEDDAELDELDATDTDAPAEIDLDDDDDEDDGDPDPQDDSDEDGDADPESDAAERRS